MGLKGLRALERTAFDFFQGTAFETEGLGVLHWNTGSPQRAPPRLHCWNLVITIEALVMVTKRRRMKMMTVTIATKAIMMITFVNVKGINNISTSSNTSNCTSSSHNHNGSIMVVIVMNTSTVVVAIIIIRIVLVTK